MSIHLFLPFSMLNVLRALYKNKDIRLETLCNMFVADICLNLCVNVDNRLLKPNKMHSFLARRCLACDMSRH